MKHILVCFYFFIFLLRPCISHSSSPFDKETDILLHVIEVPQLSEDDSGLEAFSTNIIETISKLKNKDALNTAHASLAFVLWNSEEEEDKDGEYSSLTWFSLYVFASTLNTQGADFRLYDIIQLSAYYLKDTQKYDKFLNTFYYGKKIKPFISGPNKLETHEKTIDNLLN